METGHTETGGNGKHPRAQRRISFDKLEKPEEEKLSEENGVQTAGTELPPADPAAARPTGRRSAARRSLKEFTAPSHPAEKPDGTPSDEEVPFAAEDIVEDIAEDIEGVADTEAKPILSEAEKRKKAKKKKIRIACNIAIGLFSAVFVVCAVKFGIDLYQNIKGEKILQEQRDKYRPAETDGAMGGPFVRPSPADSGASDLPDDPFPSNNENLTIVELQKKYPDVCGWITLDGTNVDNLYVQGKDYDSYLRRDLNGEYVVQGTIFLEPLSTKDFSSFNTIMYGHNMKNGTMFGDIDNFEKNDYWEEHTTGKIYLPDRTYGLQIFAMLVVKSDDPVIYNPKASTLGEREYFLSYIKQNARKYRDIGATADDTFLTLSTCAYEFDGARYILVARLMTYE